jgi:two-component system chemotaxis response regulator CheV
MREKATREILLESGTNEMEILEFYLGGQSFGVNVHKLREIIQYEPSKATTLPESAPSMIGTLLVRGQSIPLIDLNIHLGRRQPKDGANSRPIVLVCQFNNRTNGFLIDAVNQIHRINWQDVMPMPSLFEQYRPRFTGSIHVGDREILIVDLEHIVSEIDPELALCYDHTPAESDGAGSRKSTAEKRALVNLMIAEDSTLIRTGIKKVLNASGYHRITPFVDGEACYEALKTIHAGTASEEELLQQVQLLISDIEMPKMDGLTLCRKIREDLGLKNLKIIVFSSLITDQMITKCESVGADGCIGKPQIPELVALVDRLCFSDG